MIIIPQNQLIQLLQHNKLRTIIMYWEIIFSNIAL